MAALVGYWPAVVAALYMLYVLAAAAGGDPHAQSQILPAISAFVAFLGLNHGSVTAKSVALKAHDAICTPPAFGIEELPHRD